MHENCLSDIWKDDITGKTKCFESNIASNILVTPKEKGEFLKISTPHQKAILGNSKLCNSKGVFSTEPINKGENIIQLTGKIIPENNEYALQIDEKKFMGTSGNIDDFINHCCKPNCFIRFESNGIFLVTLRDIPVGEELSFDYHTTEFDLGKDSFVCNCNSENCIGIVKGFKHLPTNQKNELRPFLSPFLQTKL